MTKYIKPTVVYWIYDASCLDPMSSGYIGITCNPHTRLLQHKRSGRFPLNFQSTILFSGNRTQCAQLEKLYRPNAGMGWNSFSGGYGGRQPSEATKAKMSAASTKRMQSSKARARISAALKIRLYSERHRALIGEANKRRTVSEETREKMRNRMIGTTNRLGKKHTPEAKAKISASRIAKFAALKLER
jgi:hypothetical protein